MMPYRGRRRSDRDPCTADGSRLERIFAGALDGPTAERRSFVAAACAGDRALERRALRLLAIHETGTGPLDVPLPLLMGALSGGDPDGGAAPLDDTLAPHTRVGPYEIVRCVGRGGMGAVYLAERADGAFEQRVALKVAGFGPEDSGLHARFVAERRILARLEHPHIAHLLDGGSTSDGRPWFAMEYVLGTPITIFADARGVSVNARLDLFSQVCDAVAHAHRHRIVHRDLKPSNILVTEDDTGASLVKLVDFGIAKRLEPLGDPGLTRPGPSPMTPEYAVPEQLRGDPITRVTDVYALGLVLYELLSGQRVYGPVRLSAAELARVVCEQEPRPPSEAAAGPDASGRSDGGTPEHVTAERVASARATTPDELCRQLRGDLDAICLTALAKEPAHRYPSVQAMAVDVRRHREGRPVRARRLITRWRTLGRARRHRTAALALAATLTVAIAVVVATRPGTLPTFRPVAEDAMPGRSASALRLFEEGLRALDQDLYNAQRLFRASLAEDSTLVSAAFYAVQVESMLEMPRDTTLEALVRRHASELPDRERLLLRARLAAVESDPTVLAQAETLVARYPTDPEGHYLLGRARMLLGELDLASAHLRRAVTLDSAGLSGATPGCVGCDAYAALVGTHRLANALSAAEEVAREWTGRRRDGPLRAWFALAGILEFQGRGDEALAAMRGTSPRRQTTPYLPIYPAILAIRQGAFEAADALLREQVRSGPPDVQREALWFLAISLRYQGRLREALATAGLLRGFDPGANGPVAEAQILFEMGHARDAVLRFDSLATETPPDAMAVRTASGAHRHSFALTRVAVARHAAGDTVGLSALADTIEGLGARTASVERRLLHHHVRGLLFAERGDPEAAATAFRHAMAWPNHDYTRTNLALARVLVDLGRPGEAIPILESAFHGPLETARYYVTHTELHEALGRALEAAGDRERAAEHYQWVLEAWRNADPEFQRRRDAIRRRLAALQGPEP